MSFAFIRTVRWPLLVKKKTELKEFFSLSLGWHKKKILFCSSRPGLRVRAPSFQHIHTSPGVFAVWLCHWSEVWRVCGDWTAMESLERTTVSVGETDNLYNKDTQMGNDLWKEVRRSLEIEFLVKKMKKISTSCVLHQPPYPPHCAGVPFFLLMRGFSCLILSPLWASNKSWLGHLAAEKSIPIPQQ